jgi:3-hydroxybutyryl-CoA dehydrogenase
MKRKSMELRTIAVIGSGIMGSGIAQLAAAAGYQVNMHDEASEALVKALAAIKDSLARLARKGRIQESEVEQIIERVHPELDLDTAIWGADYVVEAVPEDIELKCRVFRKIDGQASSHTIIASNTSQYSITQIAAATTRPAQVIGTHFFNPQC